MRFLALPPLALLIAIGLFWFMQWMTAPPEVPLKPPVPDRRVEMVKPPEGQEQPEPEPTEMLEAAAPPSSPPSMSAIDLPTTMNLTADSQPGLEMNLPNLDVPVNFGGSSGFGEAFGGFGGRGSGSGAGGFGSGRGFKGERLVPLSTARPQIPEYAYKQGIEGWVEVVFVVTTRGTVENVRVIDADPKGVFEAATVESVANWLYESTSRPREVKQKVYFRLEDYQYNWR